MGVSFWNLRFWKGRESGKAVLFLLRASSLLPFWTPPPPGLLKSDSNSLFIRYNPSHGYHTATKRDS